MGKLEQDVLGKEGSIKLWQHLCGASFLVQVHDDSTTSSTSAEVASRSRQDQCRGGLRQPKDPQRPPAHIWKAPEEKTVHAKSFSWRAIDLIPQERKPTYEKILTEPVSRIPRTRTSCQLDWHWTQDWWSSLSHLPLIFLFLPSFFLLLLLLLKYIPIFMPGV